MVPVAEVIRTAGKAEQVRQLVPREIISGPGDPPSEQDQVSETSRGGRQARAARPGSCPRREETVRQEFSCRPVPAPCPIFDITTQKWPYQFQCETPSSGQLLILGRREGGGNLFTCSNWSESKEGIYSANSEFSCRPVPAPCPIFDITTQKWPYQFQCETPTSGQLLILGRREGGGNLFTCSNWSESKEGIYSANSGSTLQNRKPCRWGGLVEVPDLKDGMQFLFRWSSKGFLYLRIFITPAFHQLYKAPAV
ncbi:uncharacterized protein [Chiloscyllium punctatum]|uniref:uncharacterized protein n=1 Tax=Chiloscyllium punctatum TaxID=137246 RepID=UPI003B63DC4D